MFEGPTFKTKGPYDLVSFVVRNGLGGRGNAYSVVRGYDNKWWKISDLSQEEVCLFFLLSLECEAEECVLLG